MFGHSIKRLATVMQRIRMLFLVRRTSSLHADEASTEIEDAISIVGPIVEAGQGSATTIEYQVGRLCEGIVILTSQGAALWVRRECAYAANALARKRFPTLPEAPFQISSKDLEECIEFLVFTWETTEFGGEEEANLRK